MTLGRNQGNLTAVVEGQQHIWIPRVMMGCMAHPEVFAGFSRVVKPVGRLEWSDLFWNMIQLVKVAYLRRVDGAYATGMKAVYRRAGLSSSRIESMIIWNTTILWMSAQEANRAAYELRRELVSRGTQLANDLGVDAWHIGNHYGVTQAAFTNVVVTDDVRRVFWRVLEAPGFNEMVGSARSEWDILDSCQRFWPYRLVNQFRR